MNQFKKNISTTGMVFAIIALVLTLIGNVTTLLQYIQIGVPGAMYGTYAVSALTGIASAVFWLVILIRRKKDTLACVLLALLALNSFAGVTRIVLLPFSGISALVNGLILALLAVDCVLDLKMAPGTRKLLMGGGMILAAVLSSCTPFFTTLNSYKLTGRELDAYEIVMVVLLPSLLSFVISIPSMAARIITAFAIADTRKGPADSKTAQGAGLGYQNPGYQNNPYQNQGYQNNPYQNQGYQNNPYRNQGYQNNPNQNQGYQNNPYRNQGYQNNPNQNQGYQNNPYRNQGYQNNPNQGQNNYQFQNDPNRNHQFQNDPNQQPWQNNNGNNQNW